MFVKLLKSNYQIQKLQQSCRGDTLHKRPLDDHQDDDKHEGEKAKRQRNTDTFSLMHTGNKNTKEVNIDKETSQELSTSRNEVPREDKAEVPQEFMGMGKSLVKPGRSDMGDGYGLTLNMGLIKKSVGIEWVGQVIVVTSALNEDGGTNGKWKRGTDELGDDKWFIRSGIDKNRDAGEKRWERQEVSCVAKSDKDQDGAFRDE
ncbi:hypothetical protein Tco_1327035 [Tanacetum coccineum]